MFKNKAVQMTFVDKRDAESASDTTSVKTVDYAQIAEIATDSTIKIATVVGAAIAANKLLTTICDIAVIAAKAKIK